MMPVTKARHIAELPPVPPVGGDAVERVERALAHVEAMTRAVPSAFTHGVRRYASIEAARADRDAMVAERMRSLRGAGTAGRP